MAELLYLWARDADDLVVISASLQDAVVKASDISFEKNRRLFAFMANRYCWEHDSKKPIRTRTGVHCENVLGVQSKNINQNSSQILALLALIFEPLQKDVTTPSPEGTLRLMFSGDAALSLHVESLKLVMQDVTGHWAVKSTPRHDEE